MYGTIPDPAVRRIGPPRRSRAPPAGACGKRGPPSAAPTSPRHETAGQRPRRNHAPMARPLGANAPCRMFHVFPIQVSPTRTTRVRLTTNGTSTARPSVGRTHSSLRHRSVCSSSPRSRVNRPDVPPDRMIDLRRRCRPAFPERHFSRSMPKFWEGRRSGSRSAAGRARRRPGTMTR